MNGKDLRVSLPRSESQVNSRRLFFEGRILAGVLALMIGIHPLALKTCQAATIPGTATPSSAGASSPTTTLTMTQAAPEQGTVKSYESLYEEIILKSGDLGNQLTENQKGSLKSILIFMDKEAGKRVNELTWAGEGAVPSHIVEQFEKLNEKVVHAKMLLLPDVRGGQSAVVDLVREVLQRPEPPTEDAP